VKDLLTLLDAAAEELDPEAFDATQNLRGKWSDNFLAKI
jgi:hypothetical protein